MTKSATTTTTTTKPALTVQQRAQRCSATCTMMPHEILLHAARGGAFVECVAIVIADERSYANVDASVDELTRYDEVVYYPSYSEQIDAAKAAAAYYAPRLSSASVSSDVTAESVIDALRDVATRLPT